MLSTERIQNQNKLHALANQLELDALAMLTPWLNLKVVKISGYGGKVAKLDKEFEVFNAEHGCNQAGGNVSLCLITQHRSLTLVIRDRMSALSVELYLGRVNDEGLLTELKLHQPLKTDYSFEEVQGAFAQARQLEEEARKLLSSVSVFRHR